MSTENELPPTKGWSDKGGPENRPPNGSELWVGYWQLGGRLGIATFVKKRPPWLHRFMCKRVFGIEWRDGPWNANKD